MNGARRPLRGVRAVAIAALLAGGPAVAGERDAPMAAGKTIFVEQGCHRCHARSSMGARRSEAELVRWLANAGNSHVRSNARRFEQLGPADLQALAAYLASLR